MIQFIDKDYEENKDLVFLAIDTINSTRPLYDDEFDWNSLIIHFGFLDNLSKIIEEMHIDEYENWAIKYFSTSLEILESLSKEKEIGIK